MMSSKLAALNFVSAPPSMGLRASYKTVGAAVAFSELLVFVAASIASKFLYLLFVGSGNFGIDVDMGVGLVTAMVYAYMAWSAGAYRLDVLAKPSKILRRLLGLSVLSCLVLTAALFLLKQGSSISRATYLLFMPIQMIGLMTVRFSASAVVRRAMSASLVTGRPAVVVGSPSELSGLEPNYLLQQFGFAERHRIQINTEKVDDDVALRSLLERARQSKAKVFLLAESWADETRLSALTSFLRVSPLPIILLPDRTVRSISSRRTNMGHQSLAPVELQRAPMGLVERTIKRTLDLALSLPAVILMMPLFLIVALAIKLDSNGPIIFKQRRHGFDQLQFAIWKFRTMTVLEDGEKVVQASATDNRVTCIGKFLRRTSLDELPQLFNVLRGHMSLVGPRPHALAHDDAYGRLIDNYLMRHHVKPGITGWAQINGLRGETKTLDRMQARVEMDIWYINNRSLLLDLIILFRTCFEVMGHEAY